MYTLPFLQHIAAPHSYPTLASIRDVIKKVGDAISKGGIPKSICPLTFAFMGAGNVSRVSQHHFFSFFFSKVTQMRIGLLHLKSVKPFWKIYPKVFHMGTIWATQFEIPTLCTTVWLNLPQRGLHVHISCGIVQYRLIHLKSILLVWKSCSKSSTGGVWISNVLAHKTTDL